MTSVGSVDPWSAGDGRDPVDLGGSNTPSGTGAPADADGLPHPELLIGFLTDFHAAAREPVPEPSKEAPQPAGPIPSRFAAFTPPDPDALDDPAHRSLSSDPLPVWPPAPSPGPTGPVASGHGSAVTAEVAPRQSRLRRLGRRS